MNTSGYKRSETTAAKRSACEIRELERSNASGQLLQVGASLLLYRGSRFSTALGYLSKSGAERSCAERCAVEAERSGAPSKHSEA